MLIRTDGSVGKVRVLKSVHSVLDQEAIRVVSSSPPWTPATRKWKEVDATLEFPINFVLQ